MHKGEREKLHARLIHPPRVAQNILTIEYETLAYLDDPSVTGTSSMGSAAFAQIMLFSGTLPLTKFERLQIANLLPRSPVEFYAIVEEAEERFDAAAVDEVLGRMQGDGAAAR